jgi:hypothetical protein
MWKVSDATSGTALVLRCPLSFNRLFVIPATADHGFGNARGNCIRRWLYFFPPAAGNKAAPDRKFVDRGRHGFGSPLDTPQRNAARDLLRDNAVTALLLHVCAICLDKIRE